MEVLKIVAGLNKYRDVVNNDFLKSVRFLKKRYIRVEVAKSKILAGSFNRYIRELVPKSDRYLAKEPKTQKIYALNGG